MTGRKTRASELDDRIRTTADEELGSNMPATENLLFRPLKPALCATPKSFLTRKRHLPEYGSCVARTPAAVNDAVFDFKPLHSNDFVSGVICNCVTRCLKTSMLRKTPMFSVTHRNDIAFGNDGVDI